MQTRTTFAVWNPAELSTDEHASSIHGNRRSVLYFCRMLLAMALNNRHLRQLIDLVWRSLRVGWCAVTGQRFGGPRSQESIEAAAGKVVPVDEDEHTGQWAEAPYAPWAAVTLFGSSKGRSGQKGLARSVMATGIAPVIVMFLLGLTSASLNAQTTETMATGSFIVNMGVVPQTVGNGLKPYGMIYDLTKNYMVPIKWVINSSKAKDGIDFSYAGTDFKGGPFIIPAEYRTPTVNSRISYWQSQGVVGVTTTSPVTVPVYTTIRVAPRWTLDKQNGSIAVDFFTNAGIPAAAYGGSSSSGWDNPADLDCCDDIFVMPHADPTWATHQRLFTWNLDCKGAIWLGCHAGSALEDMFNPSNPTQQTNFLANKTTTASGGGPYFENALILWGNHSDGTLPYTYDYPTDPVMQFMGILDAATQNGSEQIFIPKSAGWRPTTRVGVYDPDHPQRFSSNPEHRAAIVAYGPGFGDPNRANVMMEASHDIAKATAPANVAAQRAFFNFCLVATLNKEVIPDISGIPSTLSGGIGTQITYNLPPGVDSTLYTTQWSSSCGGTFSPNATSKTVTFTPPSNVTSCIIMVQIKDACGREFNDARAITVSCALTATPTVTNVSCNGGSNGSIVMTISGAPGPYSWNWSRLSPASTGSGTGTTISGLSAGTYNVTVTSSNNCTTTFSTLVTQPAALSATTAITNYPCFGQTGSINLTVSGGTPAYTYDWSNDGPETPDNDPEDLTGLTAGNYTVTVTDSKGCITTASATVTGPASGLSLSATMVNVSCFGGNTGSIDLSVSGGTAPFTYDWSNDGAEAPDNDPQDLSGLTAGTYVVTVTDANGCTATLSKTITQPSALMLSVLATQPTCPPGPNPINNDGAINLTVSGGTAPYSYSWSNLPGSPDPQDQTGLGAGTYTVIVTDANGCTATISATLVATKSLPNPPAVINN